MSTLVFTDFKRERDYNNVELAQHIEATQETIELAVWDTMDHRIALARTYGPDDIETLMNL